MAMNIWTEYRLVGKAKETPRIVSLTFERSDLKPEGSPTQRQEDANGVTAASKPERVQPGSHIRVKLGGKLVRAYSVVGGDSKRFELAIALSETSRGGSHFIHQTLRLGDSLSFGKITPSFPLSIDADKHVFIAGGIGITAFIASAEHAQRNGYSYQLHYLVRRSEDIALKRYLDTFGSNVTFYDKSAGKIFSAAAVLGKVNDNAHIYCCGSDRLQNAIVDTAASLGMSRDNLHFEKFEVATSGDPFVAELADSGRSLEVEGEKTLLDALREAGLDIPSSCEAGNCGTCRVGVRRGRIEHRGTGLIDEEKGSSMLSCVSRGVGTIVLDL
jgi:ferredoxin-NADP reductase